MLDEIKEFDYIKEPFELAGRSVILDQINNKIKIGCKSFDKGVVRMFFAELYTQGIEQISFKFIGGLSDKDTLTRSRIEQFLKRISEG